MAPAPEALDAGDARRMLSGLDALLMPGGWDVDPAEYGEARDALEEDGDPALDRPDTALVGGGGAAGVPVFGICRGQQVINVALGGSLMQHIDGHDMHGQPRNLLAHRIDIDPDSELAQVTSGETLMVNSLHHQSVKDIAPGLHITAQSPDGIVEGLESGDGMIVAVQCHPEELVGQQGWAISLFRRFVDRVAMHEKNGVAASDAVRNGG